MSFPEEYRYTKDHEWVALQGDVATVGITEFAQAELGELVFVELPKPGRVVSKGQSFCVVESTKAASDVYAPLSGTVIEVNENLGAQPSLVNEQPHTQGWLAKIKLSAPAEVEQLLSAKTYTELVKK